MPAYTISSSIEKAFDFLKCIAQERNTRELIIGFRTSTN
jgi:hypothetical protein